MTQPAAYVERAPQAGVRDVVECVWRHRITSPSQLIVPDACIDVIWFDSGRLEVAGPDTAAREQALVPGETAYGVRLRPGAAAAALGRDVSELCDRQAGPTEVWGERGADVVEQLAHAAPTAIHDTVLGHLGDARPDPLVQRAAALFAEPDSRVVDVASTLGVSERQLRRRCIASVGYGPKTLARVLRLRRLQDLADTDLAARALGAGYANQAHMSDEVRRLTGTTPSLFLRPAAA